MEKIRFRTLGSVELRTSTRELHTLLVQPKRVALLAYLCVAGRDGLLRRDTLLPLFWPEFDADRARASLRRALHFLRATLGDASIVTRGNDEVGISSDAVSCDAVELEAFLAAGEHGSALEYYRGPFLDGLNPTESSAEFEQWIDAQRMRFRSAALHSALHLAREAESAGNLPKALELARRAREIDSLDEAALRTFIDLLSKSGNRTAAIRAYDDFARDAARLELQPSDETIDVVAAMRLAPERPSPTAERDAAASATPAALGRTSRIPGETALEPTRDAPIGYHQPSPVSRSPVQWIFAGAALTTLAAAILAFASRMQSSPPDSERMILVLPFENRTGDSTLAPLGGMAADWVTQGLMSIPLARVVVTQTVMQSAREITLAGPKAGDRERMRQLVAATGARILVTGAYYRQSDSLIFQARVSDAQSGQVLRTVAPSAGLVSLPLEAVDRLRRNSLTALASVLDARVETFARAGSVPPSYESYVEYVVGSDLFVQGSYRPAIQHLTHSFVIDTTYVLPYLLAAIAQNNLGNRAVADTMLRRLETQKDRLAVFYIYSLEWLRAVIDGDRMSALGASRKAGALAPGSFPDVTTAAAAQHVNRLGESRTILERIDPNRPDVRGWIIYWVQLATTYHLLSEYDREMAAAQRARETNRQSVQGMFLEARARVARRDIAGVMTVVSEAETSAPSAGSSPGMLWRVAGELRWHGDTATGTRVLRRAIGVQRSRRTPSGQAPANDASLARLLYWVGDVAGADTIARRLVENDSTDLEAMGLLGLIAAKQGRVDDATRWVAALAAYSPRYLDGRPTFLRASIAARLGQRERSVQLLKEALAQGMLHNNLHATPELELLRGFVPFDDLIRPRQ